MVKIKQLLCPVDFSDSLTQTLAQANNQVIRRARYPVVSVRH